MSDDIQLAELLTRELTCLQQLEQVLEQEHQALLGQDLEAVEQATAAKNQALQIQSSITQNRQQSAMQVLGNSSLDSLSQWAAANPDRSELTTKLIKLARHCQQLNLRNGRLIAQRQQQAQGALKVLRQEETDGATYSGQGKAQPQGSNRSLGRA
jgi:flagellar biosynthesis/type III secretory pathway chaperone